MNGLISILLVLLLIGVILWLAFTVIPMPAQWRTVIIAVLAIAVILWLLGGPHVVAWRF